jgi:hypothetical protein
MGFSSIQKTASTGSSATGALVGANSLQPSHTLSLSPTVRPESVVIGTVRTEQSQGSFLRPYRADSGEASSEPCVISNNYLWPLSVRIHRPETVGPPPPPPLAVLYIFPIAAKRKKREKKKAQEKSENKGKKKHDKKKAQGKKKKKLLTK